MESLSKVIGSLFDPNNIVFTSIIIALFLIDIFTHYNNEGRSHKNLTGLMTGVGILGTFFGVVVGLLDFDVNNISGSIGPLLDGLKVSFATSVAGIGTSILTEIIEKIAPVKRANTDDPVTDSLNNFLHDVSDLLSESSINSSEMVEQMKNMRTENRDHQKNLEIKLDDALKALSEGATEEIIKALERVIQDFNDNLKEQFGENFKQLNEACLKLVDWQVQHKDALVASTASIDGADESMQRTIDAFDKCSDQVKKNSDQMETFMSNINQVGGAMSKLEDAGKGIQNVTTEYNSLLQETRDNASKVNSELNSSIKEVSILVGNIGEVNAGLLKSRTELHQYIGAITEAHEKVVSDMKVVQKEMQNSQDIHKVKLKESLDSLENALSSLTQDFGSQYEKFLNATKNLISKI